MAHQNCFALLRSKIKAKLRIMNKLRDLKSGLLGIWAPKNTREVWIIPVYTDLKPDVKIVLSDLNVR